MKELLKSLWDYIMCFFFSISANTVFTVLGTLFVLFIGKMVDSF